MAHCPHCGESVDARFEHLSRVSGGEQSGGEHATFQVVCPSCGAILGGAIMSKSERRSLL
jgi:endogenous inhibitor of DNA gyrase (YacG/DUF329 family)